MGLRVISCGPFTKTRGPFVVSPLVVPKAAFYHATAWAAQNSLWPRVWRSCLLQQLKVVYDVFWSTLTTGEFSGLPTIRYVANAHWRKRLRVCFRTNPKFACFRTDYLVVSTIFSRLLLSRVSECWGRVPPKKRVLNVHVPYVL